VGNGLAAPDGEKKLSSISEFQTAPPNSNFWPRLCMTEDAAARFRYGRAVSAYINTTCACGRAGVNVQEVQYIAVYLSVETRALAGQISDEYEA